MIKSMTKKMNNKKGFTLIELVVVIAILGILAAIAIPRLTGARDTAAVNADAASIRTIQSAISIAEADGALSLLNATKPTSDEIIDAITPDYLAAMPVSQSGSGWTWTIADGSVTEPWTVVITVTP